MKWARWPKAFWCWFSTFVCWKENQRTFCKCWRFVTNIYYQYYHFHMSAKWKKQLREFMNFKNNVRPTLKSCSFFIHWPGEIKTSHEPPTGRNFFLQSPCLKRSAIKRFKLISSWYNKNVALYIFILNFYVHFLCWFIIIWWLISIKFLSCFPIQIRQTNISIFLSIFGLTVSFGYPCWFAM